MKTSRSGRRGSSDAFIKDLYNRMAKLKLEQRGDLRSLSAALDVPKSTLQRYVKDKILRVHTVTLKPSLSEDQKKQRMDFISSLIVFKPDGAASCPMYDRIHLDEKWFFLEKTKRRVYLTPAKSEPYLHTRHKSHVPKIMFLCPVARPRVNPLVGEAFDSRIGMWSFSEWTPALRGSRNREAEAIELKSAPVNKTTYKQMLLDDILPSTKQKWLSWSRKNVVLQHDNATPHRSVADAGFVDAASVDGWNTTAQCLPPQSPDLNVLDLGFSYSAQTLQFKDRVEALSDMLARAQFAYETLSSETLENTFLVLQQVMHPALKARGGNHYKLLRMQKDFMRRLGILRSVIDLDAELYDEIMARETIEA